MLTKYEVKKGKSDFKPNYLRLPYKRPKQIEIEFYFDENCWYDYMGDGDQYDWNKIAGISCYFSGNANRSIMAAFRANPTEKYLFDVTTYSNLPNKVTKKGFGNGNEVMLQVYAKEKTRLLIENHLDEWYCRFDTARIISNTAFHPVVQGAIVNKIGSWVGGKNNSEGPFGGVAPHDMTLWMNMKFNNKKHELHL